MKLNMSQVFGQIGIILGMVCLFFSPNYGHAQDNAFQITQLRQGEYRVTAKNARLKAILDSLAAKTGAIIHTGSVAGQLFTITCAGNLNSLLSCLSQSRANLVVHFPKPTTPATSSSAVIEAWLFDGQVEGQQPDLDVKKIPANQNNVGDLLSMALSNDAGHRGQAISALALSRENGNPNVHNALEDALGDESAQVRGQALSALVRREGAAAGFALEIAMQDSDPSVRLMATNYAANNLPILKQALADSDVKIRALAAMKIEEANSKH